MKEQANVGTEAEAEVKETIYFGEFGNGRYSAVMTEYYKSAQRIFGLSPIQADSIARVFGSDAGRFLGNVPVTEIKVGKPGKKDRLVTLKEVTEKVKSLPTESICLSATMTGVDSLKVYGCIAIGGISLQPTPSLLDYINKLALSNKAVERPEKE